MLHRLSLRVLPSLALAVTQDAVRKRKRIVMFVPGLVAFGIYRAAKQVLSVAEPVSLLLLSGFISLLTAICAYRIGRRVGFRQLVGADGASRLLWITGWVGFVYGVQLSLLVLALLWLVGYDYSQHPDGPAMMAIIISCTAVARDAFEIGHVRLLQASGRPFSTFPDGAALRELFLTSPSTLTRWIVVGIITCGTVAALFFAWSPPALRLIGQVLAVTAVAGAIALLAYFGGRKQGGGWVSDVMATTWGELLKFWWWPGLAFAATYYLVLVGALLYPFQQPIPSAQLLIISAGLVGALMALYGYYLGHRRAVEDRVRQEVPASLLRCPFLAGILSRSGGTEAPSNVSSTNLSTSDPKGVMS